MNFRKLGLSCSIVLCLSVPGLAGSLKQVGLQYQGGSLPLKQNHSVRANTSTGELILTQHGHRFVVPAASVTEIACGNAVRRRFGAAVLGLVPLMDLDRVEEHYVSLSWNSGTVLFKLDAGEYREFVASLERLTGKQAVDTSKTPTVVNYGL